MTTTAVPAGTLPALRFERSSAFHRAVSARVHRHLDASRIRRCDVPAFYVKATLLIAWTVASYVLLVWFADGVVEGGRYSVSLGLASILMAFNIYHDASHNAASRHRLVNRAGQLLMDLSGSSSYVWRQRHNRIHHLYPNVHGYDCDIDTDIGVARLGPHQAHRWFYRFQHLYLWPLNGFYAQQWQFVDDVVPVVRGRIGGHRFVRPRGWDLVQYAGCKLAFLGLAFVIPLLLHPWWSVVAAYFVVYYINGTLFILVVQLSHMVEETETSLPPAGGVPMDWAEHQVRASCDFSRGNPVLGWLVVVLNHLRRWHRPGLLCIGDAAHAMSPVSGVGVNLAIQDAIATANLLAAPLRAGTLTEGDLARVQRRRALPTRAARIMQTTFQNGPVAAMMDARRKERVHWLLHLLASLPALRRLAAHLIGLGIRRERILPA